MTSGFREVPDFGRVAEHQAVGEEHGAHRTVGDDRPVRGDQLAPALTRGPTVGAPSLLEPGEGRGIEWLWLGRWAVEDPARSHLNVPLIGRRPSECTAGSLKSAAYVPGAPLDRPARHRPARGACSSSPSAWSPGRSTRSSGQVRCSRSRPCCSSAIRRSSPTCPIRSGWCRALQRRRRLQAGARRPADQGATAGDRGGTRWPDRGVSPAGPAGQRVRPDRAGPHPHRLWARRDPAAAVGVGIRAPGAIGRRRMLVAAGCWSSASS